MTSIFRRRLLLVANRTEHALHDHRAVLELRCHRGGGRAAGHHR